MLSLLFSAAAASVLPSFGQPQLHLFGPITLHPFGALVACAVLLGSWVIRKRSDKEKIDAEKSGQLVFWILVGGFIGAHLVDRFVYFPAETFADPKSIFMIWKGISSFGGFLGAIVAVALFVRKERMGAERWRYIDVTVYGFVFGWIFGRAGCFTAFDHPGTNSNFFLAQMFGHFDDKGRLIGELVAKHNLGFYEMLYFLLFLAPLFFILGKKRRNPGFYTGLICVLYAPIRFALDFLRIVDVRYFGLTPGQYGSILLAIAGVWFMFHTRTYAAAEAAADAKVKGAEQPRKRVGAKEVGRTTPR